MSFAEARLVPLVLFLTALRFSDVSSSSSTPATSVTTENVNQQNSESISSKPGFSTAEYTTQDPPTAKQTEEKTDFKFMKDNITISAESPQKSMTKNITVVSPTELELLCSLPLTSSTEMEKIEVVWKMGNKTIQEDRIYKNETETKWCSRYTVYVRNKDQLGKYTCIFKIKQEVNATFRLQVPEVHIKSENVITYVGYSVILTCSVGDETVCYNASFWTWYKMNGSEKVAINSTVNPNKYGIIPEKQPCVTKLNILELSEDDSSLYGCEAGFPFGESKGQVSLKVLTYMAPLKPFLAIAAEVIILVAVIFIYEVCSKRKESHAEVEKEFEQTETLKSEDSNGVENSTTRHRKV
ncbi:embigin [Elgaria multicarinata webbii]|uniref:embigin n=1 Tax=Elgaria multicarinata webbii TaxID=159646 RepID=UPI002FCD53EE